MIFEKLIFSHLLAHSIYFSEGAQLIAEDIKSQFLLIAFISKQAFSHLFVSHLFLLMQYTLVLVRYTILWNIEDRKIFFH